MVARFFGRIFFGSKIRIAGGGGNYFLSLKKSYNMVVIVSGVLRVH
jgi:hypothetical protein